MTSPGSSERRRPRDFDEFLEALAKMVSAEGIERGLAFRPRPSDVIISPFAKCGTTWLQQIVHGLRTGGDLDFDDVSRVVPWIETAFDLGIDLEAEQRAEPRAFKSHLPWHAVPKGCRYIVSVRDPKDALVSMYRFMEGWFFEPGTLTLEEFVRRRALGRDLGEGRDYWTHLASWWPRRSEPDTLLLAYEHMKEAPRATVERVARFLGIAADDELVDLVVRQSSLPFMIAHKDRFDDRLMREHSEAVAGLPPGSDSAKVRRGEVGGGRVELGPKLVAELDAQWQQTIGAELGLSSYAHLLEKLAASA